MGAFTNLGLPVEAVEQTPVQFGEWLPDLPTRNNPGAIEALNVLPVEGCYVPFCALLPISGASVPDTVRGASSVFTEDGIVRTYAGTLNGIYAGSGSFTNVYTTAPLLNDYAWQFIQNEEVVVAIHPQVSPVFATADVIEAFTDVGGDPPTASCGARINQFLVLGNITVDPDDSDLSFPTRIRWSGFNNIDAPWVSDPATQADFQDMPADGGAVIAIIGGPQRGYVMQARGINRLTYVGLPTVFDIDAVEDKRGPLSRDSVIVQGAYAYFPAEDGFFRFNGVSTEPIGDGKVNRYFQRRLAFSSRSRIVGAVDTINGCVMWAFPTDTSGNLSELIIYSYRENRWSHSIQTLEYLFSSGVSATVLDDLTGDLDTDYSASFDDVSLRGGRSYPAAFDINHTYGLFNGSNMAAVIDSGEYEGPNGRRVFINAVRPNIDVAVPLVTVQIATREQLIGDELTFSAAMGQELTGECPIIADGRFVRGRMNVPAGTTWRHATGLDLMRKAGGKV